jgi:hypothetical protein
MTGAIAGRPAGSAPLSRAPLSSAVTLTSPIPLALFVALIGPAEHIEAGRQ